MTHHLVGVAEVAGMLGVSRQRVHQITSADPSFPRPEIELAAGRVWSRRAIERWIRRRERRLAMEDAALLRDRVVAFFRERHGLQVGLLTADLLLELLNSDGAVAAGEAADVKGRDVVSREARRVVVAASEFRAAIAG